ncbi:hypothetical protein NEIG_02005 [Nematocida sp. ERTm5]|nr:hypothetical protein NEIG_02005 [Nematocida sp. ERTm5]
MKSIIKSVVIRPLGPLDFLNGKLFNENKLTLNKRLLAAEIEPYSKLKIYGLNLLGKNCSCKAEREKDTLCSNLSSHKYKFQSYMDSYHRALIIMFPSENNILSIHSSTRKTFQDFLKDGLSEKKSMCILASLLLLSEGIDVPVSINYNDNRVYFKPDEIKIGDKIIGIDINPKEDIYEDPPKKKEESVRSKILIILR